MKCIKRNGKTQSKYNNNNNIKTKNKLSTFKQLNERAYSLWEAVRTIKWEEKYQTHVNLLKEVSYQFVNKYRY